MSLNLIICQNSKNLNPVQDMLQKKKSNCNMISKRNFVNKKTTHSYSFVHNVYTLEKKSNKLWKTGQAKVHKRIPRPIFINFCFISISWLVASKKHLSFDYWSFHLCSSSTLTKYRSQNQATLDTCVLS